MKKSCEACGNDFSVKPSHYDKRKSCSKACGKVVRSKRMGGSGNHQYGVVGKENSSWQGGRIISNYGYVLIYNPERSTRSDNYCLEHRLAMEDHIGRKLERWEVVHHKDECKMNNSIENLELINHSRHTALHNTLRDQPRDNETGRYISGQYRSVTNEEMPKMRTYVK